MILMRRLHASGIGKIWKQSSTSTSPHAFYALQD
jgi:hypothetical protein